MKLEVRFHVADDGTLNLAAIDKASGQSVVTRVTVGQGVTAGGAPGSVMTNRRPTAAPPAATIAAERGAPTPTPHRR